MIRRLLDDLTALWNDIALAIRSSMKWLRQFITWSFTFILAIMRWGFGLMGALLRRLSSWLARRLSRLAFLLEPLPNWLFRADWRQARRRRRALIFLGALLWAWTARRAHPYIGDLDFLRSIEYPFQALFAADVFRQVLVAALAFWLANRTAACYLDDIFELNDIPAAERFIRQSAFADAYDILVIANGDVIPEHQKLPLYRIGGPGLVQVRLENAALFEKIDGTPRVIGPTVWDLTQAKRRGDTDTDVQGLDMPIVGGLPETEERGETGAEVQDGFGPNDSGIPGMGLRMRVRRFLASRFPFFGGLLRPIDGVALLSGFERRRDVIDLRDQVLEPSKDVFDRTRDGIRVVARDINVRFSVFRDGRQPTLTRPYPFTEEAIRNLIYRKTTEDWKITMGVLVSLKVGDFISENNLSEILVAVSESLEKEKLKAMEDDVRREATRLAWDGAAAGGHSPMVDVFKPSQIRPRELLTDMFDLKKGFAKNAKDRGIEVGWIGVGTWDIPNAESISERHIKAWQLTRDNLLAGCEPVLKMLQEESRLGELLRIIQDTPLQSFRELKQRYDINTDAGREQIILGLLRAYHARMLSAYELYRRDRQTDTPEAQRLRAVLLYLSRLVNRWMAGRPTAGI